MQLILNNLAPTLLPPQLLSEHSVVMLQTANNMVFLIHLRVQLSVYLKLYHQLLAPCAVQSGLGIVCGLRMIWLVFEGP